MDERKRPQRDEEAETEEEHREEEEEERGEKEDEEGEEHEEDEEEGEEREEQAESQRAEPALHAADMLARMHKVLHDKVLDVRGLGRGDERALELLYRAKVGIDHTGVRGSAVAQERLQFLTGALARLQPVLAMSRSPLLATMDAQVREIREEVTRLRKEIRGKGPGGGTGHRRKKRQADTPAERSRDGELAELVAELARKKRGRFAHDPRKHPIGAALERLAAELVALGKIAAEMSAIDVERRKNADRKAELDQQWQQRGAALAARLAQLLAGCRAGAADPQLPGAHPALVEAFAPLLGDADSELDAGAAVALAARVAGVIDQLLDHQDELVAGEAAAPGDGGARRGLLGRLFGKKGES